ncbi:hypothetical protein D3C79_659610 [compost metagenome]
MGHEELQQAVFGRAHFGWLAINGHAVADRIEQQATDFNGRFAIAWAGAAQHGLEPGDQFTGRERFGDVVVGTDFQALDLVVFLTFGGQHDDRDIAGQLVALQASGQFDAGSAREHPVEQDQVRLAVDDNGVGLLGVLGFQAVIAGHFQCNGDHLANWRFVVNDQNVSANHA